MRSSPILKLLSFLEKQGGKKIKIEKVVLEFISYNKYTSIGAYKNSKFKRGKRFVRGGSESLTKEQLSQKKQQQSTEICHKVLEALEGYKLLERQGSKINIKANKQYRTLRGRVSLSSRGFAFVSVVGAHKNSVDIFVPQRFVHGAFNGDLVAIELLDFFQDRLEGEVVKIIERARELYRMEVKSVSTGNPALAIGRLLDMGQTRLEAALSLNHIDGPTRNLIKKDSIVIVRLSGDEFFHKGNYIFKAKFEKMGDVGFDSDLERIFIKYNLKKDYPLMPSESVPKSEVQIDASTITDWKERKDLRNLYTITIDGAYSKDFDDAISFKVINSRKALLFVHIADVSYYVEAGSKLDVEAQSRGTSYYLSNIVIPMLPKSLSENLCSLIANENRLSVTAEMEVSLSDGSILKSHFYRSIIRVNHRLTYGQAEELLTASNAKSLAKSFKDIPEDSSDYLTAFVRSVWELAKVQREMRMKKGRIDLEFPEPSFQYDSENQITEIFYKKRLKSSMLIEECMLSANIAVASYLKKKKVLLLNRNHEVMDMNKLENLNAFCKAYHIPVLLKDRSYSSIAKVLEAIDNIEPSKEASEANSASTPSLTSSRRQLSQIFQIMLLRSFFQAYYSPESLGHWGLGFSDYCHFTSPIRRYPDLVVHRMLIGSLGKKKPLYSYAELEAIGQKNSEAERRAMDAERDTTKLKMMRYLEKKRIRSVTGFINGIKPDKIYLELNKMPLEAIVNMELFNISGGVDIKDAYTVYVKKIGRNFLIGSLWELIVLELDFENMHVLCKPSFL